jgi:RHS repeat-associated protein
MHLQLIPSSPNSFTRTFSDISDTNKLSGITVSSYSFSYDNNGNLITENTERHFEWDYADQMRCFFNQTGTSEPSVYSQYLYAGGTRVKKITRKSSGDKYVTVYIDGIFEHSYHLDGSNDMDEELNELHVMDDQTRVAMLRTGYDDGTPFTKYILSDHLGSSNVILETDGSVYNREEYYPFGETSFGSFGKKRYRYVGKEKDEESGLYYYGARYFQPWSCRFISVDPLALQYHYQSAYTYADNNPICKMDYNGEGTIWPPEDSTNISGLDETASSSTSSETTGSGESPQPPKHGDSKVINGVTQYYDEYANKGKGDWVKEKPKSFSRSDIEKMKKYYMKNADKEAQHEIDNKTKYDDCITSLNNGIDLILENPAQTLNSKAKGPNGTSVSETGKYLKKQGNVDSTTKIALTLKPKIDPKTNKPIANPKGGDYEATMSDSVTATALKMTGGKDGNYVFLLSLMGGYHSMTLTVNIENGIAKFYVSDQVDRWTNGWTEYPNLKTIDEFVKAFAIWNYPGKNYGNTETQLWLIKQ